MNRHLYFMQQEKNVLIHHGIKGQKWGIRRYQNTDGTLTPEGRERYGKNVKSKKVTYEDNDVVCTEFKLKNGSSFNLQKYKHAPDRSKDKLLEKYQNYALKEFDKNVFNDIDSKIKEWRKDPAILTELKEYDINIVNDAHRKNDFKNSKPGFSYNFMQHPLALQCDWSINEYDRITFLVGTDGKIKTLPQVT